MSRRTGARRGAGPPLEPRRPHPLGRRLPGRLHPGSSPAARSNLFALRSSPSPRGRGHLLHGWRPLGASGFSQVRVGSLTGPLVHWARGRPSLRVARRISARLGIEARVARRRSRPEASPGPSAPTTPASGLPGACGPFWLNRSIRRRPRSVRNRGRRSG